MNIKRIKQNYWQIMEEEHRAQMNGVKKKKFFKKKNYAKRGWKKKTKLDSIKSMYPGSWVTYFRHTIL